MTSPSGLLCLGLLLLGLGIYARAWADPEAFNADALMPEQLYRELVEGQGSWWDWNLPPASCYLDYALYLPLRALCALLGGDLQNGMALFSAVQAVLLALGSWLLVSAAFSCMTVRATSTDPAASEESQAHPAQTGACRLLHVRLSAASSGTLTALAAPALVFWADCAGGSFVYLRLPVWHVTSFVTALVAAGFFLRAWSATLQVSRDQIARASLDQIAQSPPEPAEAASRRQKIQGGISLVLMTICFASDPLTLLWVIAPAMLLVFLSSLRATGSLRTAFSHLRTRPSALLRPACWPNLWRKAGLWLFLLALTPLAGKLLDLALRPMPIASRVHPRLRHLAMLPDLLSRILAELCANPALTALSLLGALGLVCALLLPRARLSGLFLLLATLCNVFGGALNEGQLLWYYYAPLLLTPAAALWLAPLVSCLFSRVRLLPAVFCLLVLLLLTLQAWHDRREEPWYPPTTRCLDALASTHGLRTVLANYWQARPITLFSREGLQAAPASLGSQDRHPALNSTTSFPARYDAVVVNAPGAFNYDLDGAFTQAVNGPPESVAFCPDDPSTSEVLLYPLHGARHGQMADWLLDGARVVPDLASSDQTLWHGEARLGPFVLREIRMARRWDSEAWGILLFDNPVSDLQGRAFIFYGVGDRSQSRRRLAANHLSPAPHSLLDRFLLSILDKRSILADSDNTAALPDGGSALMFRLPNRDSQSWQTLIMSHDSHIARLR